MSLVYLSRGAYVSVGQVYDLGLEFCRDADPERPYAACYRPQGHGGRHALIDDTDGLIAYVWGEDVYAETRARGRAALTAKANGRLMQVVDLIAEGADPDDAWATVEAWAGEPS